MSFLSRLWSRIKSPTGFVGRDLEGNRFYEYPNKNIGARTRRVVKYASGQDVWESASGLRRLPAQWTSWLSHTRPHPPTVAELQADVLRIQRVLYNAAVLEAKDREERLRLSSAALPPHNGIAPSDRNISLEHERTFQRSGEKISTEPEVPDRQAQPDVTSAPSLTDGSPESWTPRVIRRGNN